MAVERPFNGLLGGPAEWLCHGCGMAIEWLLNWIAAEQLLNGCWVAADYNHTAMHTCLTMLPP